MSTLSGEILGALLAILLGVYTFWPDHAFAGHRQKTRLDYLLERREQVNENLRDLTFEFNAGKYPQEDYEVQRAVLEKETAAINTEIAILQG